jgi:Fn3 associated/Right handed beta helix region/GH141 insertion domain
MVVTKHANRQRVLALSFVLFLATQCPGATFYVSPKGQDANPGTKARPFATFERARDAVRDLLRSGPRHERTRVCVRGGDYRMTRTLELATEDSGTKQFPVIWQAASREKVRWIGGMRLTDFEPVSDPAMLARLSPAARGHVLQVNLKEAGVTDLGQVFAPGGREAELVCNHQYMTLARYPNRGDWLRITAIPKGGKRYEYEHVVHYGRFAYDDERPARWKDTSDLWVHGYWVYDWSDQYHHVQKLDLQKKEVWPEPPLHRYGYKKGQRFYFLNVFEELDQPGEWYLDRKTSILYFWPLDDIRKAEVFFPEFQQPMLVLSNVSNVSVRGMIFECSRAGAVEIKGGARDEIAGCIVRNVGDTAIEIQGGMHHRVRSCDIYQVGSTGISVEGGDRQTLAPGDHAVENCNIHHFAQIQKTYHPAVQLNGVGNRISHCSIHDAPHMAIGYAGNDLVIEYCDFTRIAQETGDVGVIYTMGDWTFLGNEFRYNYFHNVHGPGNLGCFTIYPDLPCGGIHLHGNVFYDVDQVFHSNSGRGMLIENNLFLRCRRGMSFLPWSEAKMFQEGGPWHMVEKLQAVHYDQPPYVTRYPVLRQLAEDFSKGIGHIIERELPKDNCIRRNVSWGSMFLHLFPPANLDQVMVESNLIGDDVVFEGSFDGRGKSKTYRNGDPALATKFGKRGNILVQGDPGFDDLRTGDFRLNANSQAAKLGFEPIPFRKIGLVVDDYRKSLPVTVYPPTLPPGSGAFTNALTIRILPTPSPHYRRCKIRYTLDGSEPTTHSPVCHGSIKIRRSVTVKAAAFVTTWREHHRSQIVTGTYTAVRAGRDGR